MIFLKRIEVNDNEHVWSDWAPDFSCQHWCTFNGSIMGCHKSPTVGVALCLKVESDTYYNYLRDLTGHAGGVGGGLWNTALFHWQWPLSKLNYVCGWWCSAKHIAILQATLIFWSDAGSQESYKLLSTKLLLRPAVTLSIRLFKGVGIGLELKINLDVIHIRAQNKAQSEA